jgi:hypothetical protein
VRHEKVKPLAWLFLVGIAVAGWGWSAALAPRRLRAPLPPSIEALTPLAATENPRGEAALAFAAVFCFVIASVRERTVPALRDCWTGTRTRRVTSRDPVRGSR